MTGQTAHQIADALTRKCGLCGAKPGEPCHNRNITANQKELPGRRVHYYRIEPPEQSPCPPSQKADTSEHSDQTETPARQPHQPRRR